MDRRQDDRRQRVLALRWPDRRSGFDRRHNDWVSFLRDSSLLLILVLGALNIFNVLDLRLTLVGIARGALEANPIMAQFIGADPALAALFKIGVVLTVSLVVWLGRRRRLLLQFAVIATCTYACLIGYHLVGLAFVLPGG